MVVEADFVVFLISVQFTTVPFKPILTESIDNIEIKGEDPWAEALVKANKAEFTVISVI